MYTYFVAYFYVDRLGRSRMGNTTLELPYVVINRVDIRNMESMLQNGNPNYMYISVTNFQVLSAPTPFSHRGQTNQEKGDVIC